MKPEGFELPIHRSLIEPILLGGVPRPIGLLNGTIAAAFGLGMQSWIIIPVSVVLHIAAVIATKQDPQFFECFKRHINQKNYYST